MASPMPQSKQLCPFTIAAGDPTRLVSVEGQPAQIPIRACPCLGPDCLAFSQFTDQSGKVIGQGCARLATNIVLDRLASAAEAIVKILAKTKELPNACG
jgi:hypothetical protein